MPSLHWRLEQLCGVAVLLMSLCFYGMPLLAEEPENHTPLVLALYFASYDWDVWAQPHCDEPPSPYVSADVMTVDRHVREAWSAGIDGLVQIWYGPTLVDNPTEPNLGILLNAAPKYGVQVAAMLDVSAPLLQTTDAVEKALYTLRDEYTGREAYLKVDGRPVIFILGSSLFPLPRWEALRNRVDPEHAEIWIAESTSGEGLGVFDGLFVYNVAAIEEPGALFQSTGDVVRAWRASHGDWRYWVATVMPGYDAGESADQGKRILRPRQGGQTYRESWASAVASDPDWVLIRSFNEWRYCTQIEPAVSYGDQYLHLTAELIAQSRRRQQPTVTPHLSPRPDVVMMTASPPAVTAIPTVTLTPVSGGTLRPTSTPTPTLTPTATPFRLPTPTPTMVVHSGRGPEGGARAPAGKGTAIATPTAGLGGTSPAPTPLPRMPVEGYAPRGCSLLPLLITMLVVWGTCYRNRA